MGIGPGEVYSPAAREPERLNERNYRITPADNLGAGSLKQKARDNFAAIELAQRLDAEGRSATDDEKRVLVKYVGWGGIPQVFADFGPPEWKGERERLKELLPPEIYEAARASTLNAWNCRCVSSRRFARIVTSSRAIDQRSFLLVPWIWKPWTCTI